MPANLTPEYKKAEELFRQATSQDEKLAALELMLQTIPKHKGTDHMQADLKRRIAKLREGPRGKAGSRQGNIFHVVRGPEGGQVVLLGTPNSGKSSLVANMTKAHVQVADFPFSTHAPIPGVMYHEDVPIQLVDMPPITAEHVEPGQTNAYRQCDLILMVVDLSAVDVTEEVEVCLSYLRERTLIAPADGDGDDELYRRLVRPYLCVASKSDLTKPGDFGVLEGLYGQQLKMIPVCAHDEDSLRALAARVFSELHILRVYSKLPHKPPEMKDPFVLGIGSTVIDLAYKVHRELAEELRYARGWGEGKYPGQQIPRDYTLHDKDIVELHFA